MGGAGLRIRIGPLAIAFDSRVRTDRTLEAHDTRFELRTRRISLSLTAGRSVLLFAQRMRPHSVRALDGPLGGREWRVPPAWRARLQFLTHRLVAGAAAREEAKR